jgi:exodeoxyribonuclease VIII
MKDRIVGDSLSFGTAFHSLLLEPETFGDKYEPLPAINTRTNAGKAELEELLANNPDKIFIPEDKYAQLMAMSAGVLEHPKVRELLSEPGHAEVSFYGEMDGEEVKVRADLVLGLLSPDKPLVVIDLKTTPDASPEAFRETVRKYNYHAQEAWYRAGIESVLDREVSECLFLAAEKEWPYHAGVYRLSEELREEGEKIIAEAWGVYRSCKEEGKWPHYGQGGVMEL